MFTGLKKLLDVFNLYNNLNFRQFVYPGVNVFGYYMKRPGLHYLEQKWLRFSKQELLCSMISLICLYACSIKYKIKSELLVELLLANHKEIIQVLG